MTNDCGDFCPTKNQPKPKVVGGGDHFLWTPFPALLGLMAEVTTIFASMLKTQRNWYLEDHPTARFSGETTSDGKSPFSGLIPFISFIHG